MYMKVEGNPVVGFPFFQSISRAFDLMLASVL